MFSIWQESSIHGVRYISDRRSNRGIRLFWLFSFSLSIIGLFYYGKEAFIKFSIKPDINLVINLKPIREIPFPAVTICSPEPTKNIFTSTDLMMEEFEDYLLNYDDESLTDEELGYIAASAQACNSNFLSNLFQDRPDLLELVKAKNISNDIVKMLDKISFPTEDIFRRCESYHGLEYRCSHVMRRVITEQGFCYTYNLLDYDSIFNAGVISSEFDSYKGIVFSREIFRNFTNETQWTLGTGYVKDGNVPFRIVNRHKFIVDLKFSFDAVYACGAMNRNYKMIIHLPSEYPTQFHYFKYIDSDNANRIIMKAEYFDSNSDLKKFAPDKRGCYFEGERKLKFFKTYTRDLCHFECLANYTLETCGCVRFSMPREQSTPVCNLTQTVCYEEARSDWFDLNADDLCQCHQPCTYILYYLEDEDRMANGRARLEMYFDDFQVKSHKNFVSYQLQNLIAEFGGLLGLFMGCSLLSIVELIYFCFASVANVKRPKKLQMNILPTHVAAIYASELQPKKAHFKSNFQREFCHRVSHTFHMEKTLKALKTLYKLMNILSQSCAEIHRVTKF